MDSNDEFETAERIPVLNDQPFKIVFSDSRDEIKSRFNIMEENIHLSQNVFSTKKQNIKLNKSQWLDKKYTMLEIPFNYTIKGFVTDSNGFMNISIDKMNNQKKQRMFAIFFLDNLSVIDVNIIPPKTLNWKLLLGVFFIATLFVYMMMNMIRPSLYGRYSRFYHPSNNPYNSFQPNAPPYIYTGSPKSM